MNKTFRNIGYIFIGCMALTACGNSKFLLDRGIESYQEQNYRQAFIRLKPVAEAGNAEAQYALGFMYYYGQGVIEDRKTAVEWFQKSAMQGNLDAIKSLKLIENLPPSSYLPSTNPKKRPL